MSHSTRIRALALACALGAAAGTSFAGTVDVRYAPDAVFTDAGSSPLQREARLAALAKHLQGLGERLLPAGQALQVDLLNLDMAGNLRTGRRANDLRVVRDRADGPRIELRYTLSEQGQVLRSGQELVSDLNFRRLPSGYGGGEDDGLRYEKQALTQWFTQRFGPAP